MFSRINRLKQLRKKLDIIKKKHRNQALVNKSVQDVKKNSQNPPKTPPRPCRGRLRRSKMVPKDLQEGSQTPLDTPKSPSDSPRIVSRRLLDAFLAASWQQNHRKCPPTSSKRLSRRQNASPSLQNRPQIHGCNTPTANADSVCYNDTSADFGMLK